MVSSTMPDPMRSETALPRYAGIDALRGLSILLVVLHHLALRIPLKKTALADIVPGRVLGAISYNGYEAVFVFFVISGFLIANHSLARWGSLASIDLRAFYARRAGRILPCLLLLLAVLSLLHLAGAADYVIHQPSQSLPRALVAALGLHLNWYEGATGYLPGSWDVLWSLSIEETFYLGFPLVCMFVRSRALLAMALVALVCSIPFALMAITGNEIWKEKAYLPGMGAVAAGVLDASAPRRMAVLDPLKLVIDNLDAAHDESIEFSNHPKNPDFGTRKVPFSRELWIEREDFMEEPVKGFHRLVPGGEVRLRGIGIVRCDAVVKDERGVVIELQATLDASTRPGQDGADRKVKGTIHWVSAAHAVEAEVRLYDRLFDTAAPDDDSDGKTYVDHINPASKRITRGWLEPSLAEAAPEAVFQFERTGYFVADRHDHMPGSPVFNRVVTLRDAWVKARG